MLVAFLVLLLMPPVELRTTSASAAARAEDNQARSEAAAAASGEGAHRAPVEAVVGESAGTEPEGRHAGATASEELQDPR